MKTSIQFIRELPQDERPRERLLEGGGSSLSDAELLAILLRTGHRGCSVLDLARQVLVDRGGLIGFIQSSSETLSRKGIGPAKTATILAAVEIGRRMARARIPERSLLNNPGKVASYLLLRYSCGEQEVMGCLFLDTRNCLIGEREVFRGTLNRAAVEPRPLLKQGLLCDAAGIVVFHTHPSGDPSPSVEDLAFTKRLAEAAEIVGLQLVDHLIVGSGGRWVSLRERISW
ncbi:MAG: DNA repair protein RadC [Thermoanaerobaculia bacterium]